VPRDRLWGGAVLPLGGGAMAVGEAYLDVTGSAVSMGEHLRSTSRAAEADLDP
jgi:hypothetical protein